MEAAWLLGLAASGGRELSDLLPYGGAEWHFGWVWQRLAVLVGLLLWLLVHRLCSDSMPKSWGKGGFNRVTDLVKCCLKVQCMIFNYKLWLLIASEVFRSINNQHLLNVHRSVELQLLTHCCLCSRSDCVHELHLLRSPYLALHLHQGTFSPARPTLKNFF